MLRERLFNLFKSYINEAIDSFTEALGDVSDTNWESRFENYKSKREQKSKNHHEDFENRYKRYKEYYQNTGSYGNSSDYQSTSSTANDLDRKYYEYLEVPYGSDYETIKNGYKQQMKKYHPDKFYNNLKKREAAEKVCIKLNEAYQYFSKKQKK